MELCISVPFRFPSFQHKENIVQRIFVKVVRHGSGRQSDFVFSVRIITDTPVVSAIDSSENSRTGAFVTYAAVGKSAVMSQNRIRGVKLTDFQTFSSLLFFRFLQAVLKFLRVFSDIVWHSRKDTQFPCAYLYLHIFLKIQFITFVVRIKRIYCFFIDKN